VQWQKKLTTFFKGLSRQSAIEKGQGIGRIKEGKDAMQFSLYQCIGKYLLEKCVTRESVFTHAWLVLSWNLMCRASNTKMICFAHLDWVGNALAVYFAHMKNDQEGTRPKDPRHIYANPVYPEICPILAIALYFLTYKIESTDAAAKVFPGQSQYDRYQKELTALFQQVDMNYSCAITCWLEARGSHRSVFALCKCW